MFFKPYDMENILKNVQTSMLINVKQDNLILQTILFPVLIGIAGVIMTRLSDIFAKINFDYILSFFKFNKNETNMEFEGTIIKTANFTRIEFDHGLHAIYYYLFTQEKVTGLRSLKKIPDKGHIYDECYSNKENKSVNIFENFFVSQTTEIKVNDLTILPDVRHQDNNSEEKGKKDFKESKYFITISYNKYKDTSKNMNELKKIYDKIIQEYKHYKDNNIDPNQYIYTIDSIEDDKPYFDRYNISKESKTINHIFFDGKDKILRNIKFFEENQEFYISRGKPYRKIFLVHGVPGCGKTSLLLSLLNLLRTNDHKYKRHLIHLNLNKLTRKSLMNIFFKEHLSVIDTFDNSVKIPFDRRIYVIEEIDGYEASHKRDPKKETKVEKKEATPLNKKNSESDKMDQFIEVMTKDKAEIKKDQLSVTDLLEVFDGIPSLKSGEYVFMTTNHLDKIDDALKRPGRVNHLIELGLCSKKSCIDMIEFYYSSKLPVSDYQFIKENTWAPAFVESICDQCDDIDQVIERLKVS